MWHALQKRKEVDPLPRLAEEPIHRPKNIGLNRGQRIGAWRVWHPSVYADKRMKGMIASEIAFSLGVSGLNLPKTRACFDVPNVGLR